MLSCLNSDLDLRTEAGLVARSNYRGRLRMLTSGKELTYRAPARRKIAHQLDHGGKTAHPEQNSGLGSYKRYFLLVVMYTANSFVFYG